MPSLRKRVSTYFRQLSFHNEPRDKRNNINDNAFVTKYLQGTIKLNEGPQIIYGKNPTDLPNYELNSYENGPNTIVGCYSGPNGGLTTVKRQEKHLSLLDADIDFIDTVDNVVSIANLETPKKSPKQIAGQPIDNSKMLIKVAGHEYVVTNKPKRNKSHSLGSMADFNMIEIEKTKIDKEFYIINNNCDKCLSKNEQECDSQSETSKNPNEKQVDNVKPLTNKPIAKSQQRKERLSNIPTIKSEQRRESLSTTSEKHNRSKNGSCAKDQKPKTTRQRGDRSGNPQNYALLKSKSEGNPFDNRKKGKIIKIERPSVQQNEESSSLAGTTCGYFDSSTSVPEVIINDSSLPLEWNRKSEFIYGLSDSLYDKNQVTKIKNGDPIADCFGIIARNDSAILAVADGVNWGEKASIAAKSAVHGSLHYLDKTIFNNTKLFDNLTTTSSNNNNSKSERTSTTHQTTSNLIRNTREVFVCLLRAFNCAHDLILENNGMLTTLTVAVVLPLKQKIINKTTNKPETRYVCCVCNVGDTLAYVYSQKYGVRELTKGSHDINSNRDVRDALGALGPVDGINPELNNLTLSITNLEKGDIVMVASDGLTDNFDPNICKFTVINSQEQTTDSKTNTKPNQKPPRNIPSISSSSNIQKVSSNVEKITSANVSKTSSSVVSSSLTIPKSTSSITAKTLVEKSKVSTTGRPYESSQKPPIKPPRKNKTGNRDDLSSRSSTERSSIKSNSLSIRSTSTIESSSNQPASLSNDPKPSLETHFDDPKQFDNPLIAQFMSDNCLESKKENADINKKPVIIENKATSLRRIPNTVSAPQSNRSSTFANRDKTIINSTSKSQTSSSNSPYKFLRSKTALDFRIGSKDCQNKPSVVLRNLEGVPYVTPIQRYELQLLLLGDILKNGISGRESPCTSAKKLCESLISFTMSITAAKRRTLEDPDLYFENRDGIRVEVSGQEKKLRRKRGLEKVQPLPGKLDHVTVVAYNVGNFGF